MPETVRIQLQKDYGESFEIGESVVDQALQNNEPSVEIPGMPFSRRQPHLVAEINLPDGEQILVGLMVEEHVFYQNRLGETQPAFMPVGEPESTTTLTNDIPNRRITKKVINPPFSLVVEGLGAQPHPIVVFEFPTTGVKLEASTNGQFVDPQVPADSTTQLRRANSVLIPTQRLREVGAAKITIQKGQ